MSASEQGEAHAATLIVMDIDGVLADVRHRLHFLAARPKLWDEFFEACVDDAPLEQGLAIADAADHLVYFSGRPERYRAATLAWLEQHGFPRAPLHLRPDADRRPARDYKPDVLAKLGGPSAVRCVYDDDDRVIQRLETLGYSVVHVRWMPATDTLNQLALFDAQEREGRT
ncbi:MAG: hypothetical protein EBU85_06430 [Actinobacteria bacterium]|nr:hypothetical protein [Actinomycetota bacterium]